MNTASIPSDVPVEPPASVTDATLKLVRTWVATCNDFRERERREIIAQVPSPKRLAEYREELKWRGSRNARDLV